MHTSKDELEPMVIGEYTGRSVDAGGIRIAFEGLVTDQSYLPPVIAALRRFLSETGVSVRNPME